MDTMNHTTHTTATGTATGNTLLQAQATREAQAPITAKHTPYTTSQGVATNLESLGEKLGQFKAYDAQLSIPDIEGTRIVKCLYQVSPKTGKKIAENSYVRISTKHLSEELVVNRIAELSPYVLNWLQGLEDLAIKESHKNGQLSIHCEFLSLDSIIEKLEESEQGARLNKEKIADWFNAELMDNLATLFAAKMGLDENSSEEQLLKVEAVINAYREKFCSLAGGKTFIPENDCIAMTKVITSCNAESTLLGARFITRLAKMQEKEEELLLAL